MKKSYRFIAALAAASLAFSCAKVNEENVEPVQPEEEVFEYIFRVSDKDNDPTKTTLDGNTVKWEENDKIGVYATGTTNKYGTITTLNPVQFPIFLSAALSAGDKVYCYYPYNKEANDAKDPDAITLTIPATQSGDFDAMPQVSIPYEVTADMAAGSHNVADIYFCNIGSVAQFMVYSSTGAYSGETVESITLTGNTGLAGSVTFDLTAVDYSDPSTLATTGYASLWAKTTASPAIGTSTSDAGVANLVIAPGTYYGTIQVKTDVAQYTYTIAEANKITFNRSKIKKLALNLESVNCVRVEKHPVGEVFVPATSIADGDVILITNGNSGDVSVMGYQKTNNRDAVSCTIDGGAIISTASMYPLLVKTGTVNASYFSLFDPDTEGYLYAAASNNNYLKTQATNDVNSEWEIVLNGSSEATTFKATGSSNRNFMRFNSNLFSCYSSASNDPVYVFKKSTDTFVSAANQDIAYTVTGVVIDYNVYNASGETTVAFNTNPGNCASNLAINEGTKKVTFDITVNDGSTRTVTVDITNNGVTRTVSINQAAVPSKLVMSTITATPDQNEIVFSWDAVANATGYQVSIDGGSSYLTKQDGTSYTWTGLDPLTDYTLYVKAIGDGGVHYLDSDPANKTSTTLAPKLALASSVTWTKATQVVSWTDSNTGAGTYGTDYKYVYTLDDGVSETDATTSTTAELSIAVSKTIKVKAIALTSSHRDSDWTSGTYCVVGDEINYVQAATITAGDYLICFKSSDKVATEFSSSYISTTDLATSGKTSIAQTSTLDGYSFKIEALTGGDAGYFTIKQGTKYIGYSGNNTKFATSTTVSSDNYKWSFSVSGDAVTITCKGATSRVWGWYDSSNQFRCYSGSDNKPTLYKRSTDL